MHTTSRQSDRPLVTHATTSSHFLASAFLAERRPSHWKNLYRLDIFHGRASGNGKGDPMALNRPKTPPNPPVFPIVRSITTPTVIFTILPLSNSAITPSSQPARGARCGQSRSRALRPFSPRHLRACERDTPSGWTSSPPPSVGAPNTGCSTTSTGMGAGSGVTAQRQCACNLQLSE